MNKYGFEQDLDFFFREMNLWRKKPSLTNSKNQPFDLHDVDIVQ